MTYRVVEKTYVNGQEHQRVVHVAETEQEAKAVAARCRQQATEREKAGVHYAITDRPVADRVAKPGPVSRGTRTDRREEEERRSSAHQTQELVQRENAERAEQERRAEEERNLSKDEHEWRARRGFPLEEPVAQRRRVVETASRRAEEAGPDVDLVQAIWNVLPPHDFLLVAEIQSALAGVGRSVTRPQVLQGLRQIETLGALDGASTGVGGQVRGGGSYRRKTAQLSGPESGRSTEGTSEAGGSR